MQRLAAEVAAASDLSQAALGLARLAAACGSCHTAVEATPTLMAALPRGEDTTLTGRMRKHYRAADLLYRGLVVPSTHSWDLGAEALSGDPATLDLKRGATPHPEIEALAQRLHDLTTWPSKRARQRIPSRARKSTAKCSRPAPNVTSVRTWRSRRGRRATDHAACLRTEQVRPFWSSRSADVHPASPVAHGWPLVTRRRQ
jgi:hypothetical protein